MGGGHRGRGGVREEGHRGRGVWEEGIEGGGVRGGHRGRGCGRRA